MRSGIKTLLALICVLAMGALAWQFWSNRPQEAELASNASCAIYRSFYNQVTNRKSMFVRTTSRPYVPAPTSLQPLLMQFERDTGKFQSIPISSNKKPFKKPIRTTFVKDTSGYFEPLLSSKPISIERCFDKAPQRPQFYNGSFEWLSAREAILDLLQGGRRSVAILSVSPAGFSDDGHHALIYAEYYCTGFCGSGAFYLFEMRVGSWTVVGDNWVWVS